MDELYKLVIAALLHDIGKFAQRAYPDKNIIDNVGYCPKDYNTGKSTHKHVLYTDDFIENILPLPPEINDSKTRSIIARMAASHHNPASENLFDKSIQIADQLSAGIDRIEGEKAEGSYTSARLVSIFDEIQFEKTKNNFEYYYPLLPIDDENFVSTNLDEARKYTYQDLYNKFLKELDDNKNIITNYGLNHYINSFISLLEKYTCCVPSSTYKTQSDISLYDHSITTASIAQSLYIYHMEKGGLPRNDFKQEKKFIFFGGDISGIQDYIFSIDKSQGSGITKLFRARSLCIQAITKSIILSLTNKLNLHQVSKIIDAGGRFILLLPATKNIINQLDDFEYTVQKYFYDNFKGTMGINIDFSIRLKEDDFKCENFHKCLDKFNDALERKKQTKFNKIFEKNESVIFDLDYEAFSNGVCKVCNNNPIDTEAVFLYRKEYNKEISICMDCYVQINLIGKSLPKGKYLVFSSNEINNSYKLFTGIYLLILNDLKEVDNKTLQNALDIVNYKIRGEFSYQSIAAYIPTICDEDLKRWESLKYISRNEKGDFIFSEEILKPEMPKTFSLLGLESKKAYKDDILRGKPFLGMLKADVDNLGLIFSKGLEARHSSISRIVNLSRMLNHFFSDVLVSLVKNKYKEIYIVFSGGDDLLMVGPWTMIIEFTLELKKLFNEFVANNKKITLSAGIAICKSSLPIFNIVEEAEEMLELSKKIEKPQEKNSVTMFGITKHWDEFEKLCNEGDWFLDLLIKGIVPVGLIVRLLKYSDDYNDFFYKGKNNKGLCLSHLAYDLARNVSNVESINDDIKEKLYKIKDNTDNILQDIRLPVSYALYRYRTD